MKLLQVTLVAAELEPVVDALCSTLSLRVAFRDPGVKIFGLENAVLPVGRTFVEVVSPIEDGTAAGRQLSRNGGDGGYMAIFQVEDLAPWREHLASVGVRIAWEGGQAPKGAAGPTWEGLHLHPADTGGTMLSLDRPDPPSSWLGAGLDWERCIATDTVNEVVALEYASANPDRLAARWSDVLDRPLDAANVLRLDSGELRFRMTQRDDAERCNEKGFEGLATVVLRASDRARAGETLEIGGVQFRLV